VIAPTKQPAGQREWHVNSIGMTMLKIPAGSFTRRLVEDPDATDQGVTLTRSFLLSDREVSVSWFQEFVDDPECPARDKPDNWQGVQDWVIDPVNPSAGHPAEEVAWYDAVLFCNWLSREEDLQPYYERTGEKEKFSEYREADAWREVADANGYRLPTEAEWEYACRATTTTVYAFGSDVSLLDEYAVYRDDGTELCASKMPNGWGLFDMHGNVAEWCQDWWDVYSKREKKVTDPPGPRDGNYRVVRSGSYSSVASESRSDVRDCNAPTEDRNRLGFRVARTCP